MHLPRQAEPIETSGAVFERKAKAVKKKKKKKRTAKTQLILPVRHNKVVRSLLTITVDELLYVNCLGFFTIDGANPAVRTKQFDLLSLTLTITLMGVIFPTEGDTQRFVSKMLENGWEVAL